MNCRTIQEQLPDAALGHAPMAAEVELHLGECSQCAETLQALRATMNLLDEWEAPEPSPYWNVRMQARLREEQQQRQSSAGWLQWLRRPAITLTAALALAAGVGLTSMMRFLHQDTSAVQLNTGTAVSDLQYLDKNSDLLQNFTALDDIDGDADIEDIAN
jgi:predicted anti-sigma-YlaC factor YlaD